MGEYSMEFNSRPVTVRVWQNSPTVLVWLKATKNPLDFEEFDQFVLLPLWMGIREGI